MVTLATPTFTGLDVGLPGSAKYPDDARSAVKVTVSEQRKNAISFGFAGHIGEYQHTLGEGGFEVSWELLIRARTLTILQAIEQSIIDTKFSGEGSMTVKSGRVYARVSLIAHRAGPFDLIRRGELTGWARRVDVLTFRVLAPS